MEAEVLLWIYYSTIPYAGNVALTAARLTPKKINVFSRLELLLCKFSELEELSLPEYPQVSIFKCEKMNVNTVVIFF